MRITAYSMHVKQDKCQHQRTNIKPDVANHAVLYPARARGVNFLEAALRLHAGRVMYAHKKNRLIKKRSLR